MFLGVGQIKTLSPLGPRATGSSRRISGGSSITHSHTHTCTNTHTHSHTQGPLAGWPAVSEHVFLSAAPVAANHQASFNAIKEDVNTAL